MTGDLLWTDRALKEYDQLVDYLYEEWGEAITLNVVNDINKTILRIQSSPENFPVLIIKKKIRRCVLSPQTSIYFRVNRKKIEILSLFDNRQNPRKRKL